MLVPEMEMIKQRTEKHLFSSWLAGLDLPPPECVGKEQQLEESFISVNIDLFSF